MGKFKKGLVLGGLLGAGLTWMSTTKKGRETREKMLDQAADVYGDVKKKVLVSPQWDKMTKNEYVRMVQDCVDKYCVQNKAAQKAKSMIVKVVSAQWGNVKKEIAKKKKK